MRFNKKISIYLRWDKGFENSLNYYIKIVVVSAFSTKLARFKFNQITDEKNLLIFFVGASFRKCC